MAGRPGLPLRARLWVALLVLLAALSVVWSAGQVAFRDVLQPLSAAIVLGIVLTEVFAVWSSGRPKNLELTISELFVAVALVAIPPASVVLVALAGSCLAVVVGRLVGPMRAIPMRSWWVVPYGIALPVLRASAAVATMVATEPLLTLPWAAVAGVVVLQVVDVIGATIVVWLDAGVRPSGTLLVEGRLGSTAGIVAGALGVLVGLAVAGTGAGWLLVLAIAGLAVPLSRFGMRVARERQHGRILLVATQTTHGGMPTERIRRALCERAGEALHAERVEVTLTPAPWAEITAPLGRHGWVCVAERSIASQQIFDHRDLELLESLATVAETALDNAVLVAELERADRVRATLLAAAAHDLRGPLAATSGSLETLEQHGDRLDAATNDRLLRFAERGARKALRIVHDLIELERQHLAPRRSTTSSGDVHATAARVLDDLDPESRSRCELAFAAGEVPPVAMEAVLLERVLDNLVGNALKHTPHGGLVHLRVRCEDTEVEVRVDDSGPGVPEHEREAVLAPFAQGDMSVAGYGLGLHVANQFVREAGGSITVADREDGPGASFRVVLPRAEVPTASAVRRQAAG